MPPGFIMLRLTHALVPFPWYYVDVAFGNRWIHLGLQQGYLHALDVGMAYMRGHGVNTDELCTIVPGYLWVHPDRVDRFVADVERPIPIPPFVWAIYAEYEGQRLVVQWNIPWIGTAESRARAWNDRLNECKNA